MKRSHLLWVVLFAAAGLIYWGSPGNGRLPEEELAVWSNPSITHPGLWPALLGRFYDASHDGVNSAIRPVATMVLRTEFALFHQSRPAFQKGQILLLALAASFFYLLCLRLFRSRIAGLIGSLLLVAHPLGTASVLNVAGASDLLSLGFCFLAIYLLWKCLEQDGGSGITAGWVAAMGMLL